MNIKSGLGLYKVLAALACLLILSFLGSRLPEATQAKYWSYSTPEAQGVEQGYGYLWWQGMDGLSAAGIAGQRLFVFPQHDIIIAVTGDLLFDYDANRVVLTPFYAIRSDDPLPESDATRKLAERINAIEDPVSQRVLQLPAMASAISGKNIQLDANPLGWDTARLEIKGKHAYLYVTNQTNANVKKFVIGLDDLYRATKQKTITAFAVPEPDQRWNENPFEFAFILGVPVDESLITLKGR
jgi:hypothetical protein